MYKILCDGVLICDSRIEELALVNPVVQLEENKAGSFSFYILPEHPAYDSIQKRKSLIEVYQDNEAEPIFCGVCVEETKDFYKQKKVYCEGELTFLNDSIQRPARYQNATVRGLLEAYIAKHNEQVEENKRFTVGQVTVSDKNDSLFCYTNMDSTMKAIKEDLVDDLGGFFRIRHVDGVRYIDYLAESQNTNTQSIKIGKNLLDFTTNIDASEIATAIIPLGCKDEERKIEGLDTRLTIESVNNGLDYVCNDEAVDNYGWIYKTVVWDDATTPEALKSKGERYLSEIQFENMVIEAKAVDLHLDNSEIEKFKLSDEIRVVSKPHGLDKYFRLTKITINPNNPGSNTITLGKEEKVSLSVKTNQENAEIKKAINEFSTNSIMEEAIENATQLIKNSMNGYITTVMNEDGVPTELLIMDTPTKETATKVWRWNINGLGYSNNGYDGDYALAMTMDGTIVADFIKAGVLTGVEINNGNGTFKVDNQGSVTASNAKISGDFDSTHKVNNVAAYGVKIEKGSLTAYNSNTKVLNMQGTNVGGINTLGLNFCNETYAESTGMTSINGISINTPQMTCGNGNFAHLYIDAFSCNGNASIYGDLYCSGTIRTSSGTVSTSDANAKNSIEELNQKEAVDFINSLKPCKFKYNDGTSGRFHHGFIAQEVKEAMGADDWGVYIDGETKGLRYEELIADLVATVQVLNKRVSELEEHKNG